MKFTLGLMKYVHKVSFQTDIKACFCKTVAYLFMHVHAINAPDIVIYNILCENFSIIKHHLLLALQSAILAMNT